MKCDKLQRYTLDIDYEENVISVPNDDGAYIDAYEVDAAIAELKAKLADKDKEIESLKASHYAESVDAGMRERRLRRALYKACANWARYEGILFADEHEAEKWSKMIRKCLKKAEEYK